jgi:RNA polymerase sigma-70 factor (ECF subfamily)
VRFAVSARHHGGDPEREALLADSVGVALLVVLDRLVPAERLAFVLHEMFVVPFDQIGRSWGAARRRHASLRAAPAVAATFSGRARAAKLVLLDGFAGAVWAPAGRPRVVFGFAIQEGKIVEIELLADPEQLRRLDLATADT